MKNFKRNVDGITLIALVVTIIVLLILAGVTIAMLTGENGILGRAGQASETTKDVSEDEQVKLAVADALLDGTGTLSADNLTKAFKNEFGTEKVPNGTFSGDGPWTFKGERKTYTIETNGKITSTNSTTPATGDTVPKTLVEALGREEPYVFQKDDDRTITDSYGNSLTIPEGFKIADDSATDVTRGVVIEDASEDATKGSQFVWIPVGEVKKGTKTETITLSRYTFSDGTDGKTKGTSIEQGDETIENKFTENLEGKGNAVADTEVYKAFTSKTEEGKTKVEKAGGYYIGRYEARTPSPLSAKTSDDIQLPQLTEKADDSVYNWVTQPQESKLCKNMYQGKTFKSDLMNSYAWDTAIVYLQTFDDREAEAKGIPYSYQNSLNVNSPATKGTKELELGKQDKICNIWDMASNYYEMTTETLPVANSFTGHVTPCTRRGGYYGSGSFYASTRVGLGTDTAGEAFSFRPLLVVLT